MSHATRSSPDVLDLTQLPVDRRAGEISRAFRALAPGGVFWIYGCGDAHRYEHFLYAQFPSEVEWVADFTLDGPWLARVSRG